MAILSTKFFKEEDQELFSERWFCFSSKVTKPIFGFLLQLQVNTFKHLASDQFSASATVF